LGVESDTGGGAMSMGVAVVDAAMGEAEA
jgi:hypothetical protein